MKKKTIVIGVALVALTAWIFGLRDASQSDVAVLPGMAPLSEQTGTVNSSPTAVVPGGIARRVLSTIAGVHDPSEHETLQIRDVEAYGTVIDQFDAPLANIAIDYAIDRSTLHSQAISHGATSTDLNGHFAITHKRGAGVVITPKAVGYVLIATNNRVLFSAFLESDPLHYRLSGTQRVIRMWKLQGPEPLVKLAKAFFIPLTNGPLHIDLLTGVASNENGDLKFTVRRPVGRISPQAKQDWSLSIEAVDGDVQEVSSMQYQFSFAAPTNGYSPRIVIDKKAIASDWTSQADLGILVRSRNGHVHSKVGLNFLLEEEPSPSWVGITAISNPNESRNWEEDPAKITILER